MSGLPNFFANFPDGRATHQGAAMFHVDEPQGDDSTTSVSSRLDCSRRGVGTPNRRGSQPTSVGLELDAVSEASDKPMPSRSPTPSDVEMHSRSPSPSDVEMRSKSPSPFDIEMEDLSMEFGWLFNESPGQDEEMEDLTVDFGLLFDESQPSSRQHSLMMRIEGGSNPVSAFVPGTGDAEANVNGDDSHRHESFWSANNSLDNVAVGPGSPMDCNDHEESIPADSIVMNPTQAPASDVNITTDAAKTAESSKDVGSNVAVSKKSETPQSSSIHLDSFNCSNLSYEMPQVAIAANASDPILTPDASTLVESTDSSSKEIEKPNPTKNGDHLNDKSECSKPASPMRPDSRSFSVTSSVIHEAIPTTVNQLIPSDPYAIDHESLQISATDLDASDLYEVSDGKKIDEPKKQRSPMPSPVISEETVDNAAGPVLPAVPPTSAIVTNILNDDASQSSPPTVKVTAINSELASMKKQISVWQQRRFIFNVDPEPKQVARKHTIARSAIGEPPYKVRILMKKKPTHVADLEEAEKEEAGSEADAPNEAMNVIEEPANQQPQMPSPPHVDENNEEVNGPEAPEIADSEVESDVSSEVDSIASIEVQWDEFSEADLDALSEADQLSEAEWNAPMEVTESDAESITTVDYIKNLYDEYNAADDEEEWRNADLPDDDDDDDNVVYEPVEKLPVRKLIDTDDNASSDEGEVDENDNGTNFVPPRAPSDDDASISSADDQSGDEEVDEGEPERETTPSLAPSTRSSTPVASVNGTTPPKSPSNNGAAGNSDNEPEFDVPPMDDNTGSDATDQSDAESTDAASEDEPMEVDEPEVPVAAPKAVKRRNPVDPWKDLSAVKSFRNATLPAPHDVVVQDEREWYVQQFSALTPQMLQQEVRGNSYIAGLYDGKVVFQGTFEGVQLSSALMSMAAVSPQVIFNDPTDPIIKLAGGRDHLVMLGLSGRLYTLGRANEGQLGQDPSRHRYRTPTPLNMRRRVLEELVFTDSGRVKSHTPEVFFDHIEARGNVTIAWCKNRAFRCGTLDNGLVCSSTFKRCERLDRRV